MGECKTCSTLGEVIDALVIELNRERRDSRLLRAKKRELYRELRYYKRGIAVSMEAEYDATVTPEAQMSFDFGAVV